MKISVLLFASYADKLGTSSLSVELDDGSTVGELMGRVRTLPGAERLPDEPLVAVNQSYAKRDFRLSPGDEVAIIPPVAGG
ncbi:MAG TPA: molybdopterin converting factor subunit 1 [Gemmatimonadaceae bacterium]|nr:molybdopterin converting factor subunit 1 [Gemmatimonadaceae bacterium]